VNSPPAHRRSGPIFIFGTGQGADTARRYFASEPAHAIVGHVVDREFLRDSMFHGRPVVASEDAPTRFPPGDVMAFVPLGPARMNIVRRDKFLQLKSLGYRFASYIHPSNHIHDGCEVGENCFILENQSINLDVTIGDNVVIWSGCQIGDRSRIGDHVFMASHVVVNGDVEIGEASYLGSNSTIGHGVRVGRQSFIGANALIGQNTKELAVHVVEPTPALEIDSVRFVTLLKHPI
jgi:sugar O-acyltransferase (sialic acid O-acetyltransferase NeuD family)